MSVAQSSPGGRTASGTSAVTTFTNLPMAGRSIVVKAWGSSSSAPTSLAFADNQTGNTYVVDVKHQRTTNAGSWTAHARMFFAKVTAGTFAVTVSGAPAASEIEVSADEVSDLDGTVNTSNSNDATTGNASTGAITTTKPDCYLSIAMSLETASNPATVTTPANFNSTNKQLNGATNEVGDAAYRYVQAIQTAVSPAWTNTSAQWSASIVAYGVNPYPASRPNRWFPMAWCWPLLALTAFNRMIQCFNVGTLGDNGVLWLRRLGARCRQGLNPKIEPTSTLSNGHRRTVGCCINTLLTRRPSSAPTPTSWIVKRVWSWTRWSLPRQPPTRRCGGPSTRSFPASNKTSALPNQG